MARKPAPMPAPAPDPLADPFDGGDLPDKLPAPPAPRMEPGCGQLASGCVEIVLIAMIAMLACSLISLGLVLLAQRGGVIDDAPPTAVAPLLSGLPTVAALNVPTLAAIVPTAQPGAAVPDAPSAAEPTEAACTGEAAWWAAQEPEVNFFLSTLFSANLNAKSPSALLADAAPRRTALNEVEAAPCLDAAQLALMQAADATLAGLNAAISGDDSAYRVHVDTATSAFAAVLTSLWDLGVFTAPDAPTTRGIARESAAACDSGAWFAALQAQIEAFETAQASINPATASPLTVNVGIGQLNQIVDQTAALALEAPDCVGDVQRYTEDWMNAAAEALRLWVAGDLPGAEAQAAQAGTARVLAAAWVDWLGVE